MSTIVFDFLTNSFLFHEDYIEDNYKDFSNSQIEKELQDYRKHCLDNYDALVEDIDSNESTLKVFSGLEKNDISLLKQTALYIDQFIIYDPLFKFTETESEISKVTAKFLGYTSKGLDRKALAHTTNFLKQLTPMVANGYVKVLPASYHFEAPEKLPIYLPTNYYNDILPSNILEYFHENAEVKTLERVDEGWRITDKLEPCRGIHIRFKGQKSKNSFIYHLFEVKIENFDEDTGKMSFYQTLPDTPPEINRFNAWITQSINSSAKAVFDKIYLDNLIASKLNSTFLCDNSFTAKLLTREFEQQETIQSHTATELINLELPFLDNIRIDKLMEIRKYEEDVFTNFRIELEKRFRELRTVKDPKELELRKENIIHELNDVQVQRISRKIKSINRNKAIDSILFLGGLAGAIQTGGISLLSTAIALGKGYKDFNDYNEKIRENPSYLLWKIQDK